MVHTRSTEPKLVAYNAKNSFGFDQQTFHIWVCEELYSLNTIDDDDEDVNNGSDVANLTRNRPSDKKTSIWAQSITHR